MKALMVTGSVITKNTARGYLFRVAKFLQSNLTMESSVVLSEIEEKIVKSGFLTWSQIEEIEIEALN